MSDRSIQISFRLNFPVILITILALHILTLFFRQLPKFTLVKETALPAPFKVHDIKTVGAKDSKIKNSSYVSNAPSERREIYKEKYAPINSKKNSLSLSDLSGRAAVATARPGSRPEITEGIEKTKSLNAISLKGHQIQQFAQGSSASSISGDPRKAGLSNSDILVNLEVPEGVDPDELNKYELMFYGFQRRTAINYINSFYKNLDRFQRENPHLEFPMTSNKQIMTGRLTYDEKGNIKQIKMVRWSNVDRLQDFFVDVLKEMDTLHNPPQALWEKTGEFSIFFSLVING